MTVEPFSWVQSVAGAAVALLGVGSAWLTYKAATAGIRAVTGGHERDEERPRASARAQTTMERVMTTRILRVGCIAADPWFIFPDPKTPTGIYAVLFEDFAKRNGLTVTYQTVRNNQTIQLLNEGKVDVVASLLHTPERAERADFAAFIHNVALLAVIRREDANRITVLGDLKLSHVRAAVVAGEIGAEVARKYYDMTVANDRAVEIDTKDVPSVFYHVAHGSADVAITTGARWVEFSKREPETAARLMPAFKSKPLLLVPAGCMIKRGERDFAAWLERETELSRSKADIRAQETALLAGFDDAIDLI